jgi:hypothetical protein
MPLYPKNGPIDPFGPEGRLSVGSGPFLRVGFARVGEEVAHKSGPVGRVFLGREPVRPLGPFVGTKGRVAAQLMITLWRCEMLIQQGALLVDYNQKLLLIGSGLPILVPSE